MHVELTARGFEVIRLPQHPGDADAPIAQESAIADGFVWVGAGHHLDAKQARELGERLIRWAGFGTLRMAGEAIEEPVDAR